MSFSQALQHFQKVDPILYEAALKISSLEEISPADPEQYFANLCDSIISQQLSGKVATVIWNRILDLLPQKSVTPENILALPDEKIRAAGCSFAKIKYLKDLAQKTLDKEVKFTDFPILSNEEIARELIQVKGIGPWTAEMFLIFTMSQPDIFSYGDLGLKNAMAKLPGLQKPEKWSPYRSYASRILWKTLDQPQE